MGKKPRKAIIETMGSKETGTGNKSILQRTEVKIKVRGAKM